MGELLVRIQPIQSQISERGIQFVTLLGSKLFLVEGLFWLLLMGVIGARSLGRYVEGGGEREG